MDVESCIIVSCTLCMYQKGQHGYREILACSATSCQVLPLVPPSRHRLSRLDSIGFLSWPDTAWWKLQQRLLVRRCCPLRLVRIRPVCPHLGNAACKSQDTGAHPLRSPAESAYGYLNRPTSKAKPRLLIPGANVNHTAERSPSNTGTLRHPPSLPSLSLHMPRAKLPPVPAALAQVQIQDPGGADAHLVPVGAPERRLPAGEHAILLLLFPSSRPAVGCRQPSHPQRRLAVQANRRAADGTTRQQ